MKRWNWQQTDWPNFRYERDALRELETDFLRAGGVLLGSSKHLGSVDRQGVTLELAASEAVMSADIEGDVLDRASVQSSIRRRFGLQAGAETAAAAERGMAEMMVDLLQTGMEPLDQTMLFRWHRQIMQGREDRLRVGSYRSHTEPMQVVSGPIHAPKVHFEAPPSERVAEEMRAFTDWFQRTAPGQTDAPPALARAGIAHLYFVSIHPFEDGNGRLARALSEKALSQAMAAGRDAGMEETALMFLSMEIRQRRKSYFAALEAANRDNEITDWLLWFGETVQAAQRGALNWIEFLIHKARLLDRLREQLNARQEKALLRVMRDGPGGFEGGLTAGKYQSITGASPASAGRDLAGLVQMGALIRTGERKHTRYWLPFGAGQITKP